MNTLLAEQAELQEKIDARGRLGTRPHASKSRSTRCAARRRTARSPTSRAASAGAWRCAGCCSKSPTCCCSTNRPTISTPKAWPGWKRTLHDYAGTVLVVTHDRYFLENVTNWILEIERGRGYPFEGNYSSWLEQKRKRLQQEEKEETARMRALAARAGMDRLLARARARPRARRASRNTRKCCRRARSRHGRGGNRHPARAAAWRDR